MDHRTTLNEQVTETPGQGLSCQIDSQTYHLGKPLKSSAFKTQNSPFITCTFSTNDQILAIFQFKESARPDAAQAFSQTNLPIHILSGDASTRVKTLAKHLHLNPQNAHGDLHPEEKSQLVQTLNPALYLGDGANDSLAFDTAHVTGSPVADRSLLDTKADFLFTQPSLSFLPHLLRTARWRHHKARRILSFTVLYNISTLTLCLGGQMTPLLAAILMPLSSLFSLALASAPMKEPLRSKKPADQFGRQALTTTQPLQ